MCRKIRCDGESWKILVTKQGLRSSYATICIMCSKILHESSMMQNASLFNLSTKYSEYE